MAPKLIVKPCHYSNLKRNAHVVDGVDGFSSVSSGLARPFSGTMRLQGITAGNGEPSLGLAHNLDSHPAERPVADDLA